MPEALSPIEAVEVFHLVFLRVLSTKADRAIYVVKGGVNLRAWFGSLRYSEDMDLDALGGQPHAWQERVDRVVASRDLALLLRAQGLTLLRATKPKQTDTTQRWKFQIATAERPVPLPTKLELSHRVPEDDYILEPVRAEVARRYGVLAPSANHYTAPSAIRQKVRALAGRAVTQARDVWDLDHLFRTTGATRTPTGLPTPALRKLLPVAIDRAMDLSFAAFRSQVVPYLAPADHALYGTEEAWERMRELVVDELGRMAR